MAREPRDLLHGTLDVLVLKSLSLGHRHGYDIARWIEERTAGLLGVEDAALYKALHRLERQGALGAEWGVAPTARKAKYYHLTDNGRALLAAETTTWDRFAGAVYAVLRSADS